MSIVAIDFGSTDSCVGVMLNGKVEIVANDQGNRTSPSLIAFNEQEQLAGEAAKSQCDSNPHNTIYDIKFMLGRKFEDADVQEKIKSWPFKVVSGFGGAIAVEVQFKGEKKQFSAEDLAGMVLKDMAKLANKFTGVEAKHAILSVPTYFNEAQSKALSEAAKNAGLEVLRIVKEATAAAIAYGFDDPKQEGLGTKEICVVDFGGGTCEASIVEVHGGVLTLKSDASDPKLGGDAIVHRLVDFFKAKFEKDNNFAVTGEDVPRALAKLKAMCRIAKSALSSGPQTNVSLDSWFGGKDLYDSISRSRFEMLVNDMFQRTTEPIKTALKEANVDKSQVDAVLLVGGCTRIPKVKSMISKFFGNVPILDSVNPNEAVAVGVAIQASLLQSKIEDEGLDTVPTVPTTSLGLGLAVAGGIMVPVVPKGTPLPASVTIQTSTCLDNQTSVELTVLEGERVKVADNKLIGKFALMGLKKAARGVPKISVTFAVDAHGAVSVSASEKTSKQTNKLEVKGGKVGVDKKTAASHNDDSDKAFLANVAAFRELYTYVQSLKSGSSSKVLDEVLAWLNEAEKSSKVPSSEELAAKRAAVEAATAEAEEESEEESGSEEESEEESEDEDLD